MHVPRLRHAPAPDLRSHRACFARKLVADHRLAHSRFMPYVGWNVVLSDSGPGMALG